jgi:hypothetical protein
MMCHQCGKPVQREDRFCTGCGTSLAGVTDSTEVVAVVEPDPGADPAMIADEPTEQVPAIARRNQALQAQTPSTPSTDADTGPDPDTGPGPDDEHWNADDPVWAATGTIPAPAGAITAGLPATEPITEVWMAPDGVEPDVSLRTPYDFVEQEVPAFVPAEAPTATAEMPTYVRPASAAPARPGFRLGAISVIALITGSVAMLSLFMTIVAVTSDTRLTPSDATPFGFRTGTWIADDLADNLSIAGLLAILVMIVGGVAAGFHWRWGSGLAGGAGLALAGVAAITLGLAQIPIDAAHEFAAIPSDQQFVLTVTRDLGYWLLLAAGALGVVLFFAAINDASGDRRGGLDPWIAALGALAVVVAAAGPLVPENTAAFSDNWFIVDAPGEAPAMLIIARLVQLGLLLVAGVVGFLTVRRWGLGLGIGGSLPVIWMTASTLFELTDRPVGPGFRNPGAVDMHVHGVTIIGVSAIVAMAILAVIAAYDQAVRERP